VSLWFSYCAFCGRALIVALLMTTGCTVRPLAGGGVGGVMSSVAGTGIAGTLTLFATASSRCGGAMLDRVTSVGVGLFVAIMLASGFGMGSLAGIFMPDIPGSGALAPFVGAAFGAVFVDPLGI